MKKLYRYIRIFFIYFKISCIRELAFRVSFFTGIIGSFVFVVLNWAIVHFLMQKISLGLWTEKEMLVLLGCFFIVDYSFFFFFWRGFIRMPRNIRDGVFDFYLIKPLDLQFSASIMGGGIHNLMALVFGIFVLAFSIHNLGVQPNLLQILTAAFCLVLSILDLYSLMLLLITLNFRFGFIEEVINFVLSFQDFSRYPLDVFSRLPVLLFIFAAFFSSLSTIPAIIFINSSFPIKEVLIFVVFSLAFICFARKVFFRSVKHYQSAN